MRKTALKKVILKKWDHFENGQRSAQSKGYSPCKILSSGQKLKLPKTCHKCLYKQVNVNKYKKRLEKTANIKKWEHFENGQKLPHAKYLVWVKK